MRAFEVGEPCPGTQALGLYNRPREHVNVEPLSSQSARHDIGCASASDLFGEGDLEPEAAFED